MGQLLMSQNNQNADTCVLVVDDEPFVRRLIGRWLDEAGYKTFLASHVQDANAIIATESVDVITSDINMPGMSGVEWLPRLHAAHPNIAVLMLTGCTEIRNAVSTLTQGAWGYLIKPIEKHELLFQIDRAVERQRLLLAERDRTLTLDRKIREQARLLKKSHEETIERLIAASRLRDEETGDHIRRLGTISAIVACQLGWSSDDVDMIRMAASMHDIGKLGIPDSILQKPGKLTNDEYEIMKTHTQVGAAILSGSKVPMLQMAEQIALWHHERWDGTGYPDGLCGEQIPLAARIVAVADVFDALSHDRVYRQALPKAKVLEIMKEGSGSQFDSNVLKAFFDSLPLIQSIFENEVHKNGPSLEGKLGFLELLQLNSHEILVQ